MSILHEINIKVSEQVQTILEAIQSVFPSAVLAGGYLRDLDYGLTPKDVDIFVVNASTENMNGDMDQLKDTIGETIKRSFGGYGGLRNVDLINKYVFDGINVDLVFVNIPTDQIMPMQPVDTCISSFDLSICQIGYDGKHVQATQAYIDTKNSKVINIMNYQKDRLGKRAERMRTKFPDFVIQDVE